jgi:hypothetical protein
LRKKVEEGERRTADFRKSTPVDSSGLFLQNNIDYFEAGSETSIIIVDAEKQEK